MGKACDLAWEKPSGAQLAAAGYVAASLYVGQDNTGKNMTPSVVNDYHSHGVAVWANFEYGAQQMLGGASQGHTDATLGLSQARACGMPAGRPIIFSADWQASSSEITNSIIPYLVAARGVLGAGNVGVYGSYAVVKAVHEYWAAHYPGEKVYLWQTVAWSNGQIFAYIDMYQDGTETSVGGISIDNDIIKSADAGQWPAPEVKVVLGDDDIAAVRDAVLNKPLGRNGGLSGTTTLGGEAANADAYQNQLVSALASVQSAVLSAVNALQVAPVDVNALATALAGDATFIQAIATAVAGQMPKTVTSTVTSELS